MSNVARMLPAQPMTRLSTRNSHTAADCFFSVCTRLHRCAGVRVQLAELKKEQQDGDVEAGVEDANKPSHNNNDNSVANADAEAKKSTHRETEGAQHRDQQQQQVTEAAQQREIEEELEKLGVDAEDLDLVDLNDLEDNSGLVPGFISSLRNRSCLLYTSPSPRDRG